MGNGMGLCCTNRLQREGSSSPDLLCRSDPIAMWHSKMRHSIHRQAADKGLRCLMVKEPCRQLPAKECLDAEDGGLGQAAPMIAYGSLPSRATVLTDGAQGFITR